MQKPLNMCEVAAARLEYFPLYSPNFNPIKEAFAEIKLR